MRAELLALSTDSLAALTNRGLVKRAVRDLERATPALSEAADGTLEALYEDGVTTHLPTGGLERGRCSCGATGVCRHVVALVLAYTASFREGESGEETPAAGEPEDSSRPASGPGDVQEPSAATAGGTGAGGTGGRLAGGLAHADIRANGVAGAAVGEVVVSEETAGAMAAGKMAVGEVAAGGETARAVSAGEVAAGGAATLDGAAGGETVGTVSAGVVAAGAVAAGKVSAGGVAAGVVAARGAATGGAATLDGAAGGETVGTVAAGEVAAGGVAARDGAVGEETVATVAAGGSAAVGEAARDLAAGKSAARDSAERGGAVLDGAERDGAERDLAAGALASENVPTTAAAEPETLAADPGPRGTSRPSLPWTPGSFTDAELEAQIGKRMMTAARRAHSNGYVAHVHRPTSSDPVPRVDLPSATVRFHVPKDLGYARSDAVAGAREDVLALAVWAFRVADDQAPAKDEVHVQVGGTGPADGSPALEAAVHLATTVLQEGAAHLETGLATRTETVRSALDSARLRWPLLALEDLLAQLQAYRDRSARYRPDALADHVAELFARHRAVTNGGAGLRSRILGTDEASETPLRRARLDGLGARVSATGDERTVEVFLAQPDSATVLVLRKTYKSDDAGPQLASRRIAGSTLRLLATGSVITDTAERRASRTIRIGTRSLGGVQAMPVHNAWPNLPAAIAPPDLAGLAQELDELPPRLIRARVEAELVRVIPVASVDSIAYSPGDQRLDAVVIDPAGTAALVSATHTAAAPGRLDALAEGLSQSVGQISGTVRRRGGGIVIDPIAFTLEGRVVVPDLAPASGSADPPGEPVGPALDALDVALDEAATLVAEIAHRGLHHTPPTMPTRLRAAGGALRAVGLHRASDDVTALAALLGPDPGPEAVESWVNAYLRITFAAEVR